ncbi:hydrophobin 3 precursor [Trichoderma chlorosporum]
MKYTTALIALAATAIAMPTGSQENNKGGNGGGGVCNTNQVNICCNGILAGLLCDVGVLGTGCGGGSYCCDSGAEQGGLINLNLLNCVAL